MPQFPAIKETGCEPAPARAHATDPGHPRVGGVQLVMALAAAMLLVLFLGAMERLADAANERSVQLESLHASMHELDALEWEAIGAGVVEAETLQELRQVRGHIDAGLRDLAIAAADPLRRAFEAYLDAVDLEIFALDSGLLEEAKVLDETSVDPTFETLAEQLEVRSRQQRQEARAQTQVIRVLSAVLLLVAAGVTSLLMQRSGRARLRVVLAELDQRTLGEANDQLQAEIVARKQVELELRTAKQQVESQLAAKSSFVATMSHEIRTPMNGALGMAELLLETDLSSRQRGYAQAILECCGSLQGILGNIMDFSKLQAGDLQFESVDFDLTQVVAAVVGLYHAAARGNGIALTSAIDADVPTLLRGDGLRLQQLLRILIGNAVKFTREGGVAITVDVLHRDSDRAMLRISVRDTGIGIDAATQARLFEPFVQAECDSTRRFGGTGLGLAIARGLAAAMGGRLMCRSEVGVGSEFHLEVPFRRQVTDRRSAPAADTSVAPELGGRRVLLVEDNVVNQRITATILKRWGCVVEVAGNGVEAVQRAAGSKFDVILMDCQMPELDGYGATARIREGELASTGHVPIVALTANAGPGDRQRCLQAGMDEYLAKPFRAWQLAAVLQKVGTAAPV